MEKVAKFIILFLGLAQTPPVQAQDRCRIYVDFDLSGVRPPSGLFEVNFLQAHEQNIQEFSLAEGPLEWRDLDGFEEEIVFSEVSDDWSLPMIAGLRSEKGEAIGVIPVQIINIPPEECGRTRRYLVSFTVMPLDQSTLSVFEHFSSDPAILTADENLVARLSLLHWIVTHGLIRDEASLGRIQGLMRNSAELITSPYINVSDFQAIMAIMKGLGQFSYEEIGVDGSNIRSGYVDFLHSLSTIEKEVRLPNNSDIRRVASGELSAYLLSEYINDPFGTTRNLIRDYKDEAVLMGPDMSRTRALSAARCMAISGNLVALVVAHPQSLETLQGLIGVQFANSFACLSVYMEIEGSADSNDVQSVIQSARVAEGITRVYRDRLSTLASDLPANAMCQLRRNIEGVSVNAWVGLSSLGGWDCQTFPDEAIRP